jgi:HD-GYP domain-containing protein (c-di-GMP phosphodiesterase class II)
MDIRLIIAPVIQDREALDEFAEALSDRAPEVERDVARLKKTPGDRELVGDLFRAVHNIKGDAALSKFELAVAIAHPIETLLARFRDGEIEFSELLAEAILLAIDRLELATDALLVSKATENLRLLPLVQGLEKAALAAPDRLDLLCGELIEAVTGFPPVISNMPSRGRVHLVEPENEALSADLHFFRTLALQLESRSPLFKGRTARLLRLALETNKMRDNPVDPIQLEAAIYLHDLGMMLIPETVWLKVDRLTPEDKLLMRNHPSYGAGLLERMPGWQAAAQIVMQHHEMPDGGGYPAGLVGGNICAGAKILAIIDAFEAVMLKHSHRGKNRSVLRAIAEVNACDNQFAPEWIAPFNTVIRRTIEVA